MLINKLKMKHKQQLQQTQAPLPAGGKGISHQANIPAAGMDHPQRFGTAPPMIRLDKNKCCTLVLSLVLNSSGCFNARKINLKKKMGKAESVP